MGAEYKKMSEPDIDAAINRLRKTGAYSDEVLALVREDYGFGLAKEEIELYLGKKFDISQCRKISRALRLYGMELAKVIARPELDEYCMQVSMDYYEKGVPIQHIEENVTTQLSAHALKKLYRSILEKIKEAENVAGEKEKDSERENAEKILNEMKEIVLAIRHSDEKYEALSRMVMELKSENAHEEEMELLYQRLEDKEKLLSTQQDLLQQANATIARLRHELDKKEKEMSILQDTVEKMKDSLEKPNQPYAEKEDSKKNSKEEMEKEPVKAGPVFCGTPVEYMVRFQQQGDRPPVVTVLETEKRKPSAALSVFAKIGFKKKSRQDIVRLVASGDLKADQLIQIRTAIERGLTEEQLLNIINSKASAEQMKEIIEIAVLENSLM